MWLEEINFWFLCLTIMMKMSQWLDDRLAAKNVAMECMAWHGKDS